MNAVQLRHLGRCSPHSQACNDGSIHDKDNQYNWADAFAVKVAGLNSAGGFAGYTDWRLPNRNELLSLVDLGTTGPATYPEFDSLCSPACTVLDCNCTSSSNYWSSSTNHINPLLAWPVGFSVGTSSQVSKTNVLPVRAVRSGS